MAKKSMVVKANRPKKFGVREYTRCSICFYNFSTVFHMVLPDKFIRSSNVYFCHLLYKI